MRRGAGLVDDFLRAYGDTSKVRVQETIEKFLFACRAESKSRHTVRSHRCNLAQFANYVETRRLPVHIERITVDDLRRYIVYLREEKGPYSHHPYRRPGRDSRLSPTTISDYVTSLRAFYSWLTREKIVGPDENPFSSGRIKVPKPPERLTESLDDRHIEMLLNTCSSDDFEDSRDRAIMLILLDTGVRVSELVSFKLKEVNWEQGGGSLLIQGKGAKERVVPIGPTTLNTYLHYYYRYHVERAPDDAFPFLSQKGGPLTPTGVRQMLKRRARKAGTTGVRVSPHTFRHTFARRYLVNGGNQIALKQILGHTTMEMVSHYARLSDRDLQALHMGASPVERIFLSTTAVPERVTPKRLRLTL